MTAHAVAPCGHVPARLHHSGTVLDLPPGEGDPLTAAGARSEAERALLELLD